jgi:uncharacterized phage protein gp47/JayE
MSASLTSAGLTIQTFDEILADVIAMLESGLGVDIDTELESSIGQLARAMATMEQRTQEQILAVYQAQDPRLSEGVPQDINGSLLGVTRIPELAARVLGTATGDPATSIPDGTRIRYDLTETVWTTTGGPYVIGGGGTITGVELVADDVGAQDVDHDEDWTILDVVVGFDSFESTSQTVVGNLVESHTAYRARQEIERYRRGQGPLNAVEAAVSGVTGVTYVRAWENVTLVTDANGIPGKAMNIIVEGGADADVAAAIWTGKPGGIEMWGTDVVTTTPDVRGVEQPIAFDRVAEITMWVECTITTSTSEEDAPDDVTDAVETAILEYAADAFGIGTDVLVYKLIGAVVAAEIPGIDAVAITLSIDDGVLDAYSTAKRSISIRERAVFTAARVAVVED